jgi:hypothetical protein
MFVQGRDGSINLFWDNTFICGFPLSKNNPIERYERTRDNLIVDGMRKGHCMKDQILQYEELLNLSVKNKRNKVRTSGFSHQIALFSAMSLEKFKIVDCDDPFNGTFVAPRKKGKWKKHNQNKNIGSYQK